MKHDDGGRTLLELLMVLVLIGIVAGTALPRGWEWVREYRLRGAAFYLRGLIRQVRSQAVAQSRYAALVFDEVGEEPELSVYVDGNGNGIRRADIRRGIDVRVRGPWRLSALFPGVRYGVPPSGSEEPALAGVRIGRSGILSFSPIGSSTSGTLYLSNEQGFVYGVIVLGATGRVRLGRYRQGRWEAFP